MDTSFLSERLETARRTFETLERQLADPDVAANPSQLEPIARERARLLRRDLVNDRKKPDWTVVKLQILNPLVEVRARVAVRTSAAKLERV